MNITFDDLRNKYTLTPLPEGDPRATGEADEVKLNRANGYELLAFINVFMRDYGLTEKDDALRIEQMIREYVPSCFMTRKNISQWLHNHWSDWDQ